MENEEVFYDAEVKVELEDEDFFDAEEPPNDIQKATQ